MREDVFDHKSETNATNKSNAMPTITARILARMSVAVVDSTASVKSDQERGDGFSSLTDVVDAFRRIFEPSHAPKMAAGNITNNANTTKIVCSHFIPLG